MLSVREIVGRVASGQSSAEAELARDAEADRRRASRQIEAFASRPATLAAGTGPLAGIACGVKDIIDTADLPTQMGSPIYQGWQPRADAPIVMALKAAGASVAGKTHTTAFAFLDPAPTHNPHDATREPRRLVGRFGCGRRRRHDPAGDRHPDRRLGTHESSRDVTEP